MQFWNQGRNVAGQRARTILSKRRFGIELEVSHCPNHDRLYGQTPFGAKRDGSVSGHSMEFVSPILSGDSGLTAVRNFCEYAHAHNWNVDSSCGYHLHIDVSDLKGWQRRKVAYAYQITQAFWRRLVPSARRRSRWCEVMRNQPDTLKQRDSFRRVAWNNDRYTWCNLCSFERHGTIEIRLHHGTLRTREVINWIQLHLWFVDKVLRFKWETLDHLFLNRTANRTFNTIARLLHNAPIANFYQQRGHFTRTAPVKRNGKRRRCKRRLQNTQS